MYALCPTNAPPRVTQGRWLCSVCVSPSQHQAGLLHSPVLVVGYEGFAFVLLKLHLVYLPPAFVGVGREHCSKNRNGEQEL